MYKKNIIGFLIALFLVTIATEAFSQRTTSRRSSRDRQETQTRFADNLNYEISLGNIGIGTGFSISMKGTAAYKFIDRFSLGAGGRFLYLFNNRFNGPDQSFFDYGGVVMGRAKITNEFFLQAEYNFMSFDPGNPNAERFTHEFPLIGGGYYSGYGPWKYGIQLLFVSNELARDLMGTTIDYWISFSYNF